MTVFSVLIMCAHVGSCSLREPISSTFTAESKEMCERNVWILATLDGLQDFIVTCSDKGA